MGIEITKKAKKKQESNCRMVLSDANKSKETRIK